MRQNDYLCKSWQGFIQYLVTMAGQGYYFYQEITPKKLLTEEKWLKADTWLLEKFNAGLSKDMRYRNKRKGMANYIYVRYGTLAVLLKTEGKTYPGCESELFTDIRMKPLEVFIGGEMTLKIGKGGKVNSFTVYLARDCYRSVKADLMGCLGHRQIRELEYRFGALNNLPAYTGINEQKIRLRDDIFIRAKAGDILLNKDRFWICFKRKIYKVFSDNRENEVTTHEAVS